VNRKYWQITSVGFSLWIFLRIVHIESIPIFNDEAIYLHWGMNLVRFWSENIVLYAMDGKQLFTPLFASIATLLPTDPLVNARFSYILFTMSTALGIWLIGKQFSKNVGSWALLLTATSPILLFFDRLAIPDTAVTMTYIWSMWATINILRYKKWSLAVFLGFLIAWGWWWKSTALLAVPPVVLCMGICIVQNPHERKKIIILLSTVLFSLSIGIGIFYLPILHHVASLPPTNHINTWKHYQWGLLMWRVLKCMELYINILSPLALVLVWQAVQKKHISLVRILILWLCIPTASVLLSASSYELRYSIMMSIPWIVLSAIGIEQLGIMGIYMGFGIVCVNTIISIVLICAPVRFFTSTILTPLLRQDIAQYITGWSSGWGVKEAANYIKKDSSNVKSIIFVRNDSGNPEDAMYVYFTHDTNILVLPIEALSLLDNKRFQAERLYFVSRGSQLAGLNGHITERIHFAKPLDTEYVGVYELTPR
jgi:hypothetical protein